MRAEHFLYRARNYDLIKLQATEAKPIAARAMARLRSELSDILQDVYFRPQVKTNNVLTQPEYAK